MCRVNSIRFELRRSRCGNDAASEVTIETRKLSACDANFGRTNTSVAQRTWIARNHTVAGKRGAAAQGRRTTDDSNVADSWDLQCVRVRRDRRVLKSRQRTHAHGVRTRSTTARGLRSQLIRTPSVSRNPNLHEDRSTDLSEWETRQRSNQSTDEVRGRGAASRPTSRRNRLRSPRFATARG